MRPERDPLALAMFAAWVNIPVDRLPASMRGHTCPATMEAWGRVAAAARAFLSLDVDEVERKDVCAQCKGMRGDLARGRDAEELCDPCYDDAVAVLRRPGVNEMRAALEGISKIRPVNWNEGEDPELETAYRAVDSVLDKFEEHNDGR